MTSEERHELRYQRRKAKREEKRRLRSENLGSVDEIFSFSDLYTIGKTCCCGVRWKQSTQDFERHMFSTTANTRRRLVNGEWKPKKYYSFTLRERGKIRPIDSPHITDRQVEKRLTKSVLLPLYTPELIYNNGASMKGKGFDFSLRELKKDVLHHFRKYGLSGNVILIDFKKYFPTADRSVVLNRHSYLIYDDNLRTIADRVVNSDGKEYGMPLGVEPSQAEMIAFPSKFDNYIKCQLRIKGMGHYMDDYYIIVPPDRDVHEILRLIKAKAEECKLVINKSKTKIVKFGKPFKYCKAKVLINEKGKIALKCDASTFKRQRRKVKQFKKKLDNGTIDVNSINTSINGFRAHLLRFDDYFRIRDFNRLISELFNDVKGIQYI